MLRSLFMAVVLSVTLGGHIQGEDLEGLPVTEILFSPPSQPISPERLAEKIPLKAAEPLDLELVRQSIRAMFVTGRYADIEVDAVRSDGGVKVTFITVENLFVGPVRVLNVKPPPSEAQLINATKLELGELFTPEKLETGRQSLLKLLADNGYYKATIQAETAAHSDTQQIDIEYHVDTGERAGFGKIALAGKPDLTVEQVRRITGWSPDDQFTQPTVQRGIERLRKHYHNHDHLQATVRLASQTFVPASNRVDVVVEIQPGPRIEVAISGADLSRKQLRKYVPIYEEGTIDRDLLAEGARNLRDSFQVQGYFDAKVDYAEHPEENGIILVEFQAILGERHEFVKLEIAGNHYFDTATIRERMYLQPKSVQFRRGRLSQSLLRRDIQVIEDLYRSNGFLEVEVEARSVDDYEGKEGEVAVFLDIKEGPQTLVAQLKITGNQALPAETFLNRLNSVEGQPFSEYNVASDRDLILATYFTEGFPDATMEWKVTPAAEPHRVELEYVVREGERQFVNQVIVDGYENTRETTVRREVTIYPGESLSQSAMIESQRRLYDLGIFFKVNMAIQNPQGKETYRNVLFQAEEARRWTVGVGGGAEIARFGGSQTTLDSPGGDTGFSPRLSLELNRLNLLGRAYTASFRSQLSTLQKRGILSFQAPRWRGRERLTLTFSSLYDTSRNVRTFAATRLEGALQLQHRISKPSTLFYRYSYRRVAVDRNTLKITPGLIPLLSQPVRVGLLSTSFAEDRRDDPLDAHRGRYNTVDLGIASRFTGSTATFSRLLMQNSTYHRLTRRVVLARTTQMGAIVPFGGLRRVETTLPDGTTQVDFTRETPLPERFFSGGSNSHRGFAVNQAGPRDAVTGFPIGGNGLLLNSVELRGPLRGENIGGVLFYDAGNVYSQPQNINFRFRQRSIQDFDYLVHAVGIGVRYRTPIGPVRLDLAYSINPPEFNGFKGTIQQLVECGLRCEPTRQRLSHFQFHFSLGQTF